jgi:hypothetical protein
MIASQMRLIQVIEKMYGDSAFSNPALAEYKRAVENIDKECKDSLVRIQLLMADDIILFIFMSLFIE